MKSFCISLALMLALISCAGPSQKQAVKLSFRPGDIVPDEYVEELGCDSFFTCSEIPDSVFALMQGKSYKADCIVPRADLRYLTVLHKDIEGRSIVGEMVVAASITEELTDIFRQLYEASYPIERMILVDNYDADDERSMSANNSSSFNFRLISHTTKVSKHGLGIAVDINPLYNPYHKVTHSGIEVIEPAGGKPYLDRSKVFPYKIVKSDLCCRLFLEHDFNWGGDWAGGKDYQHFEK